jgi:hypothetical protein
MLVLVGAWGALVPAAMSRQTLAWVVAGGLAASATMIGALRGGRATRSIAHVLYEAERRP